MSEYEDDFAIAPRRARNNSSKNEPTVESLLGLKSTGKKTQLSENTIGSTAIDRDVYHDCVDTYQAMKDNLDSGMEEYSPFLPLSEDIFNSLYKYNVDLKDEHEVTSTSQLNHQLMEGLLDSEEYNKLRKNTKFDTLASSMATEVMQSAAMEKVMSYKRAYQQKQQTGQHVDGADAGAVIEALNQMSGAQSTINDLQGIVDGGGRLTKKQAQDLAAAKQTYEDHLELFEDNTAGQQQLQQGMASGTQAAAEQAMIEVHELQETIAAWGIGSGDHSNKLPLDQRRKAIERIRRSNRLKSLTDLVGRFRKIAMKKRKKPVPNGSNIKTVTTGNKIEDILPSERMNLAHPGTKRDFYRRLNERGLLIYKKEDVQSVGRGPVIFCQDKSGSTSGQIDNWATALALATVEVAQKENRPFAYIPFDDRVLKTKDIQPGDLDPQDVLDIAEMTSGGGTNFMAPLERCAKVIEDSRYKKADVIFVTDGHAAVSPEFKKRFEELKKEKGFYVSAVIINIGAYASTGTSVKDFADNITTISDVADLDGSSADKIFNLLDDKDKYNTTAAVQSSQKQAPAAGGAIASVDDDAYHEDSDPFA